MYIYKMFIFLKFNLKDGIGMFLFILSFRIELNNFDWK